MELEVDNVKKSFETMKGIKYNNYDEVAEKVHDQVNLLIEVSQTYKQFCF